MVVNLLCISNFVAESRPGLPGCGELKAHRGHSLRKSPVRYPALACCERSNFVTESYWGGGLELVV